MDWEEKEPTPAPEINNITERPMEAFGMSSR